MNRVAFMVIGMVFLLSIIWAGFRARQAVAPTVSSFAECVAAGYPVIIENIRQCKTPDGRRFAEELPEKITYTHASADLIVVELPFPGAVTGKTFSVIGKARGTWFFEASFPVVVLDKDGKVIATSIARAKKDWMTNDFVPFEADFKVPDDYMGPATIVLKKDNPSGMADKDASISFPITIEY
ncbi:MAG: hypothetical protein QG589_12 [Patescibacteria group bacterium]|nr:hypothetical protein [Patescibacteria group bacterium]